GTSPQPITARTAAPAARSSDHQPPPALPTHPNPLDASMLSRAFCELVVEVAGEVSLEGAHGLSFGLAFGDSALHVGAGWGVVYRARERDCVDRGVDLAVAGAAEAVADGFAGGGGLWGGAVGSGECGLALEARGVERDQLAGADRTDARLVEQPWVKVAGERLDLAGVVLGLLVECAGAVGDVAQHLQGRVLLQARGRAGAHTADALGEHGTVACGADPFAQRTGGADEQRLELVV